MNNYRIAGGVLMRWDGEEETAVIPASVLSIGDSVFYKRNKIECIYIPNTVRKIEANAFMECPNLKTVRYMGSLKDWLSIEFNGFYSNPLCNRADLYIEGKLVKDLVIPKDVTEVKKAAFAGCASLENVIVPANVHTVGHNAFNECVHLENVLLEDGVEKIEQGAFDCCAQLQNVVIPQSLKVLERGFTNCENLVVYFAGGANAEKFAQMLNGKCHVVMQGAEEVGREISYRVKEAHMGTFSQDCQFEVDKNGVFLRYYGHEEEVILPNTVRTIAQRAFAGCNYIKKVEIPYTVVTIEKAAFAECANLQSVIIGDNVLEIDEDAFNNCKKLSKVVLGSSIEKLGSSAFYGCESLTEIQIPSSISTIYGWTFFGCGLTRVDIPQGVKIIYSHAFNSCKKLTQVTIPDSVTVIADGAFNSCKKLEKIVIPSSVTEVGSGAFIHCTGTTIYYDGQKIPKTFHKEWNKYGGVVMIKDKNGNWMEYKPSFLGRLFGK